MNDINRNFSGEGKRALDTNFREVSKPLEIFFTAVKLDICVGFLLPCKTNLRKARGLNAMRFETGKGQELTATRVGCDEFVRRVHAASTVSSHSCGNSTVFCLEFSYLTHNDSTKHVFL